MTLEDIVNVMIKEGNPGLHKLTSTVHNLMDPSQNDMNVYAKKNECHQWLDLGAVKLVPASMPRTARARRCSTSGRSSGIR
eukprot:16250678-Heterocapsa_arctica.AAC.1